MINKKLQKLKRRLWRWSSSQRQLASAILVVGLVAISYNIYMTNQRLSVDPKSYTPLLELIASAESQDNYNAYFGNANNTRVRFIDMTVGEVLAWQDQFVAGGSPSSAVGRYQIINSTLQDLVAAGAVSYDDRFDVATQDHLAVTLLERRGGEAYINREINADQFAANLAMEWAALPKVVGDRPQESYYQSSLNAALVTPAAVFQAVEQIQAH